MPGAVASLAVRLTATDRSFTRGMRRAGRTVSDFSRTAARAAARIPAIGAAVAGLSASVGSGAAFARASNFFADVGRQGSKLGVPIDRLIALRDAAAVAEISSGKLELGLQRLTRRVAEAAVGTGEAQGAIKELGLDAQELARLRPDQIFERVGSRLLQIKNNGRQIRLAFKLFDAEGVDLLEVLKAIGGPNGAGNIDKLTAAAKRLGRGFTEIDAAKVLAARAGVTRLGQAFEGVFLRLGVLVAPAVDVVTKRLTAMFERNEQGSQSWIESTEGIFNAIAKIESAVNKVRQATAAWFDLNMRLSKFLVEGFAERAKSAFQSTQGVIERASERFRGAIRGAVSGAADLGRTGARKVSELLFGKSETALVEQAIGDAFMRGSDRAEMAVKGFADRAEKVVKGFADRAADAMQGVVRPLVDFVQSEDAPATRGFQREAIQAERKAAAEGERQRKRNAGRPRLNLTEQTAVENLKTRIRSERRKAGLEPKLPPNATERDRQLFRSDRKRAGLAPVLPPGASERERQIFQSDLKRFERRNGPLSDDERKGGAETSLQLLERQLEEMTGIREAITNLGSAVPG